LRRHWRKQAELNEDRRRLREALARMAPKPAAVLVLRASGLSYAEVAQALGVGIGQIGTLLRRAEATLRKEVTHGTSN
jgi:RNA polymerase sigma factor (sigma-70 family)